MTVTGNADLSKLKIKKEEVLPELRTPRKRFWIFFYGLGILTLASAVFFFYIANFGPEDIVELTTVTLTSSNQVNVVLSASGYVTAQRKASIASKATGRLVYLGYEEGDHVKKGEVIGRIESSDVEAALEQAKANLELAKSEFDDAYQTYLRAQKLYNSGLISQSEYDAALARYNKVKASIASAEAVVKSAEVQLENTYIRAPFDGTILTKNADVGEVVTPFAAGASSRVAVVTIADMSSLEVEADVSEANIEKIFVKQPCEIILDAYPEKRYRGYVHKIVPTADRAKATVLTKVRFINRDDSVLPEMSAKVNFLSHAIEDSQSTQPKLLLDSMAITIRNGKMVVFQFNNNRVTEVPVSIGARHGKFVEITSGLSNGDKVVIDPSPYLRSNARVKVKKQ